MERVTTYNVTEDFIARLADYTEQNFLSRGRDIARLAFIFGGKRPSLFLKRELARRIRRGFFAPRFFSIDEFIEYALSKRGPFYAVSDLDACYTIFTLAKEIAPRILAGREQFSQFLPWAREILAFIEQLDFEDVKFGSLKNVQSKAAIGYDVPENINALLADIVTLRDRYHATLAAKRTYSRGLMYLLASQQIHELDFPEFDTLFFCGFFYLHKTEETIIRHLFNEGKAAFFFQGDMSEWSVLERLAQELCVAIQPPDRTKPAFNLSIQAGFDVHSEACLVREILKEVKKPEKTVIVLPEPEHIIPLLSEISGLAHDFNVSMGYPLRRSALYSLFECIFKAQESKKNGEYYAKDYLRVITHPLVKNLRVVSDPSVTRVLVHKIEEMLVGIEQTPLGGSLFLTLSEIEHSRDLYDLALRTIKHMDLEASWDDLKESVWKLHELLFTSWEGVANFHDFAASIARLLDILIEKSPLGTYPLNLKMAEKVYLLKEELMSASFARESFPQGEIFKVFKNGLENDVISFSGSPLKGLQILGLFETRSLSFDNVIVMDVNESSLPRLKVYEPLIPREVMISLGLNRLEKEEEIQRYQFRRLIASAKDVYLVYQHSDEKEKSRFIEELIWEGQKQRGLLEVAPIPKARFNTRVLPLKVRVAKVPKVLKFLEALEYSATSINTYLHCPLRFYYQYVLGLEEREDLLEEPEGADIGNFIHELLEDTFSRFIRKAPRIDKNFKDDFFAALDDKFTASFERKMKSDSFLIKEMLLFRLGRFLDNERKRDVREIVNLEKTYTGKVKVKGRLFKLKARVDRIDRLSDGGILVLDYKTGSGDELPQTDAERITACFSKREAIKGTVKSFQLPLYMYFVQNDPRFQDTVVNAALYSLRELGENYGLRMLFKDRQEQLDQKRTMEAYLGALGSLLEEIVNPNIPFVTDENDVYQCSHCAFFYLCR